MMLWFLGVLVVLHWFLRWRSWCFDWRIGCFTLTVQFVRGPKICKKTCEIMKSHERNMQLAVTQLWMQQAQQKLFCRCLRKPRFDNKSEAGCNGSCQCCKVVPFGCRDETRRIHQSFKVKSSFVLRPSGWSERSLSKLSSGKDSRLNQTQLRTPYRS